MGHAEHFLKRLERVSTQQCDLALRLYRDPAATNFLLRQSGLHATAAAQAGAESGRVALSLDPSDQGPHLVVSRNGEFITCLGAEMTLHDLPRLPHAQLERLLRVLERQREREAALPERPGWHDLPSLTSRILRRGHRLPREELLVLEALQPVLRIPGLALMDRYFHAMREARPHLMKLLQAFPTRELRQHELDQLQVYHQQGWVAAHLLALAAMNGAAGLEPVLGEFKPTYTWKVFRHGTAGWAGLALWAAGKIGHPLVASYKAGLSSDSPAIFLEGFCGLLSIALRHRKVRHEIVKMIRALGPRPLQGRFFVTEQDDIQELLERLLTDDETVLPEALELFQAMAAQVLPDSAAANRYATPAEIPAPIAIAAALHVPFSYFVTPQGVTFLLYLLPWLARLELSDLYLPGDLLDVFTKPWESADSLHLLAIYHHFYRNPDSPLIRLPVQVGPQPGRNELCPCGSGKKYKKCCLGRKEE